MPEGPSASSGTHSSFGRRDGAADARLTDVPYGVVAPARTGRSPWSREWSQEGVWS